MDRWSEFARGPGSVADRRAMQRATNLRGAREARARLAAIRARMLDDEESAA